MAVAEAGKITITTEFVPRSAWICGAVAIASANHSPRAISCIAVQAQLTALPSESAAFSSNSAMVALAGIIFIVIRLFLREMLGSVGEKSLSEIAFSEVMSDSRD